MKHRLAWPSLALLAAVSGCGDSGGDDGDLTGSDREELISRCEPDCEDQNGDCTNNDDCRTYCEGRADEAIASGCVAEQLAMRDCWDAVGNACSLECDPEVYAEIDCKDAYCAENGDDPICPDPPPPGG